ncbi:MAG: DUF5652 family protein [Patescibacteria group bacterium]|nr:DUF5652 family protein [Patescibacteria group bacterium]
MFDNLNDLIAPGALTDTGSALGFPVWLFIALMLWSLVWKGLALWHAGGRKQKIWFIILLVVNTAGVLEIIYLFFVVKFQRGKKDGEELKLSQ